MDCDLQNITRSLLQSYHEVGGINHLDQSNLPSKQVIETLCDEVLRILFPGFLDQAAVHSDTLEMETMERVARVVNLLKVEVRRSVKFSESAESPKQTHDMICNVLRRLPEVRRQLKTDVEAAFRGDPAARSYEEIILSYPCIEAISIQRLAHLLYQAEVPLIPRMMTEWAHKRTGIDIHPGAELGSHFFIDHGTGVVIGETCVIGQHVKLYHGVTLGAKSIQKDAEGNVVRGKRRHPTVEDHVTIYANATILGGETTIGRGSTIGANVFLMESVPPNSLVGLKEEYHKIDLKTRTTPPALHT